MRLKDMLLEKHKQEWEDLATMDPYWAILTDTKNKFGKWDIEMFFQTGDQEIARIIQSAKQLGYPLEQDLALDFGCGVGRLSRALAKYFRDYYGVDISENMIRKAKELNLSIPNCTFILNTDDHLHVFSNNYFDMIYTNIVLQHLPGKSTIKSYIFEFIRILKKGGLLVFQLPSYIPLKNRIQPRRRLYALLRSLNINPGFLYNTLGLHPIKMNFIPEKEVISLLNEFGAKVLIVQTNSNDGYSNQSMTYYVTK